MHTALCAGPSRTPPSVPPRPRLFPRAQRRAAAPPERPGARPHGLDRPLKIGEGRAAGAPWGAGLGKSGCGRRGKRDCKRSEVCLIPLLHARRPRAHARRRELRRPSRTLLDEHGQAREGVGRTQACNDVRCACSPPRG